MLKEIVDYIAKHKQMEKGRMKKEIVKSAAILFVVILGFSISNASPVIGQEVQYPSRAYIFIDPASKAAAIGQIFTVDVKINASAFWDVAGYDVTVEYNSSILTLLNATEGGFLQQGGASTFGYYFNTSNSIEAVFTKTSNPVPSSGVDTIFTLQFNVTCRFSPQPVSCNLELNNTDIGLWSHPERNFPPYNVGPITIGPQLLYDDRPVPPALPYTHYTVGGTFSVNLGDINNDGVVSLQDLVAFVQAYGSKPPNPNYNERADLASPFEQISLTDLVTFAVYYNYP
jgi:hypothetical protein